ncbi:MAG: SRPBCC family protein [Acidimicrobiales bacterium]|nr:SRPBCC family protein [Acidimicrobiales bacterium]
MQIEDLHAEGSTVIAAPADDLYAFISDMPRMGEVSPVCVGGRWESDERGVGATFVGSNVTPQRSWEARMRVAVADAPHEFAWDNMGGMESPLPLEGEGSARWTYRFTPVEGGTRVEESWRILRLTPQLEAAGPDVLTAFAEHNRGGIQETLTALKARFES